MAVVAVMSPQSVVLMTTLTYTVDDHDLATYDVTCVFKQVAMFVHST